MGSRDVMLQWRRDFRLVGPFPGISVSPCLFLHVLLVILWVKGARLTVGVREQRGSRMRLCLPLRPRGRLAALRRNWGCRNSEQV